jgi:hypothetical protein
MNGARLLMGYTAKEEKSGGGEQEVANLDRFVYSLLHNAFLVAQKEPG